MGSARKLAVALAVIVFGVAVTVPAVSATRAAVPYTPRLTVLMGQPVAAGETRFAISSDYRGPATADVDLYIPGAFSPDVTQGAGTQIATLSAYTNDHGVTPPFTGAVTVAGPGAGNPACDSAAHSAVWTATLTNATTSFSFTIYVRHLVNPTAPSVPQPTELHWCLPKDAPKLSTLTFDLHGVFAQPTRGNSLWDGRFTPYAPNTDTVTDGDQVSSLVLVRLPEIVRLGARYSTASHRYVLTGKVTENGRPVRGPVLIWRSVGIGPFDHRHAIATHTNADGTFTVSGRLSTHQPVRFKAHATAGFRDLSKPNCGKDVNNVPCTSKSLAVWEKDSNLVTVKP